MAAVKIIGSYVLKPAEETPTGVVSLSEFDHVAGNTWVPVLYFYKPNPNNKSLMAGLRESLSRALVPYHPLAGRLRFLKSGRMELDCNAAGVVLDEAEMADAGQELPSEMGELVSDTSKFQHLLPAVDGTKAADEVPLLHVQLTHFGCGGVSFGFIMSHAVADGCSAFYFITDWARISRGEAIETFPCHDRTILKAGEASKEEGPTAALDLPRKQLQPPPTPTETDRLILPLTKSQVEKLKNSANANAQQVDTTRRPYSRYEVLAAHIWRCTCKARGHASDESRALGIAIDARYRLPSFPKKYFGNTAFVVAAKGEAGDLVSSPLGYTCQRIRETIERVNEEYVWSEIDFFKKMDDFSICQELRALRSTDGPYVNPNPGVISWLSMPLYGLDFGWGKEVHVSSCAHGVDGLAFVYPSRDEGDVVVSLSLQVDHIDQFKKLFYDDIM
ncbi:hypothetical protein V2J09_004198 [Rumex salicifolius]